MRGTVTSYQWRPSRSPVPVLLGPLLGALFLAPLVGYTGDSPSGKQPGAPRVSAAVAATTASTPGASATPAEPHSTVRERLVASLAESFPEVDPKAMTLFYSQHNPEALSLLDRKSQNDPVAAADYLIGLAQHFAKLEKIRLASREEYERMLQIERLESKIQRLGGRVQEVRRGLPNAGQNRVDLEAVLNETSRELRLALQQVFTATQQNELIEINRIEAEVKELRRLLEAREAKKDLILEHRFLEVTGESPATDPTPQAR